MHEPAANQPGNTQESAWPTVAVVGLGFIGLPLAMTYTRRGSRVIGIDVNQTHVDRLSAGITESIESDEGHTLAYFLQDALKNQLFIPTTDYAVAGNEASAYIVTVGIPIINGAPYYDALDAATKALAGVVKPGDLILYRSTHIPGTVRERLIPMLQQISPYNIGQDIHVAYAPERVAEGRALEEFQTVDVLIGGLNPASTAHAMEVLRRINRANLHETSIEMAETVKVVENVQRDVNIAMIQEIAQFAQAMGLRTSELVKLANTHPRVNLLTPGAGVGGYCIPNAYYYLQYKADDVDVTLPILATARKTNDYVPTAIINRIERRLGGPNWANTEVAVLGLAMKHFSNDDRISPSIALVQELQRVGAKVKAYDPLVAPDHHPFCVSSLGECLSAAQVVIVTIRQEEWNGITAQDLLQKAPHCQLIFDASEAVTAPVDPAVPLLRI